MPAPPDGSEPAKTRTMAGMGGALELDDTGGCWGNQELEVWR